VRLAGACLLFAVFPVFAFQTGISAQSLPPQARQTLAIIKSNGPFPYAQDGRTFGNRAGKLPQRARGYYREYTVKTPGARDRGARRIVVGGGTEFYYTEDHYNSFRRVVDP
jgi:ribonuclease T1